MKIATHICAGYTTLEECQRDRDYWKAQAQRMQTIANGGVYPPAPQPPLPPPPVYPIPPVYPTPQPSNSLPRPAGVTDHSGWC
jgi:hypothetical protein